MRRVELCKVTGSFGTVELVAEGETVELSCECDSTDTYAGVDLEVEAVETLARNLTAAAQRMRKGGGHVCTS